MGILERILHTTELGFYELSLYKKTNIISHNMTKKYTFYYMEAEKQI
jgi:hypothetical protein